MATAMTKRLGLVAAVGAVAGAAWWVLRPPDGFLTGMMPISETRAVFTMRHNPKDGDARAWIGVMDVDGGVVWSEELPAVTYSVYARHGLTATDDLITVKVSDSETYGQILGFDPETGKSRWTSPRIEFAQQDSSFNLPIVFGDRPYADGTQLLHADSDGSSSELVARNATDGSTQWTLDVPDGMRELKISPTAIAYRTDARWNFVRRDTGEIAKTIDAYAAGCSTDERFVTWHRDKLISVAWSDPSMPTAEHALPSEGIPLFCGLAGDTPVFTVAKPWGDVTERRFDLVAVDPKTATVDWRLSLGAWEPSMIANSRDNDTDGAHPLRGTLTDFIPILLDTHGSDEVKLVVVDLAQRKVAWEGTPYPELLHFEIFRGTGDQYFLSNRSKLAALDGSTGRITAAIELGHESPRAFHAAHGKLWLYSMGWQRMNELPWAVLDGTTLEVQGSGHAEFSPKVVTDDFAGWLGAPG